MYRNVVANYHKSTNTDCNYYSENFVEISLWYDSEYLLHYSYSFLVMEGKTV